MGETKEEEKIKENRSMWMRDRKRIMCECVYVCARVGGFNDIFLIARLKVAGLRAW